MRGAIGVESTVDVGTVFWISMDAAASAQVDLARIENATSRQIPGERALPRRTVLYVEDNPANLKLVEMLIARRADLHLLSAGNGPLGVELARAHVPDVILMDINLPGVSGIKALTMLRKDRTTAHIPIVALSANAGLRDIERGLDAGFFRYLTKPIKVDELMRTLDAALALPNTRPPFILKAA